MMSRRDEIKAAAAEVARRLATPEARARRDRSARDSRERIRVMFESCRVDGAFLRRRVTV